MHPPMYSLQQFSRQLSRLFLLVLCAMAFSGCSIKMVADYDSSTFEEILRVGKSVDRFYGDMLEMKAAERNYAKFSSQYVVIETDLRSLVTRNKARALNEESTRISETTLELWLKYKDAHMAKDTYADGVARLDRGRFSRLFAAAASAEMAKKLDVDDRDASKASK